jgi:hypothetical protein
MLERRKVADTGAMAVPQPPARHGAAVSAIRPQNRSAWAQTGHKGPLDRDDGRAAAGAPRR